MPEDDPLHHANDKLFRQGFGDPVNAAGFLRNYLPKEIATVVDWTALKPQPGTFIDSEFRRHESDLLFSAPLARRHALFYFLFEHQTQEDPHIALRLLRYMVRIWEKQLHDHPDQALPVILPIVLAQSERQWKTHPAFASLLDLPPDLAADLRPFIPDFTFRLIELAQIPFDAILGTPAGIMVMRVMKAERSGELLTPPVWDETLLSQIPRYIVETILRFLMNADLDSTTIQAHISNIRTPELQRTAMTLAQKLHRQGHQEGRQQGRQEGLREGLREGTLKTLRSNILQALTMRFDQVPDDLRKRIGALTDETRLHSLFETAVRCESLDAFISAL